MRVYRNMFICILCIAKSDVVVMRVKASGGQQPDLKVSDLINSNSMCKPVLVSVPVPVPVPWSST